MSISDPDDDIYSHIIRSLNITTEGIKIRKAFLELDNTDASLLTELSEPIYHAHERIMHSFYGHLDKFANTRGKLQDEDIKVQLSKKQKDYLNELFSGEYNQDYFQRRLKVGVAHQKIDLDPQWYIGAYSKYICSLFPEIIEKLKDDNEKLSATLQALLKIIFLDIGLVLETYFQADKHSIEALKDYAENIVCSVPSGLLVLDKNLHILSANRQLDKNCGVNHFKLKGLKFEDALPEFDISDQIKEVIETQLPKENIQIRIPAEGTSAKYFEVTVTPMYVSPNSDELTVSASILVIIEDITKQQELQQETLDSAARIQAIMEHVPDGIITINDKAEIESFNQAAENIFQFESAEIIGKNIKQLMPESFAMHHDEYIDDYLQFGSKKCLGVGFRELEGQRKDGSNFPIDLAISEMQLGNEKKFIGIVRDITEKHKAEVNMRILSRALEQTADAIMITDKNGIIEYVNKGFEQITGFKSYEAINKTPKILKSDKQDRLYYKNMWDTICSDSVFRDVIVNQKKNGEFYYEEKTITPIVNHKGDLTHFISSGKDITERMLTQERLHYLAHHDVLTDLPNRLLFMERLSHALSRGRWSNRSVALLFLDLDRFKHINDTLGHCFGDKLLKLTAERLISCVREGDVVARISGDEFAILLEDIASPNDIPNLIKAILSELQNPFNIENREIHVTSSIGAAVYPKDTLDPHELMRFADVAMYRAKAKGRNDFHIFTENLNNMTEEALLLENQLRTALEKNEFLLHYQPQLNLHTGTVVGMEALLRWHHPTRGLLYPEEFIHLLEETGLIVSVGDWVIKAVCQQLNRWHQSGVKELSVSVNVSPRQLNDQKFFESLIKNLQYYNIAPDLFDIEVTENTLMDQEENTINTINNICEHGISLVMDDFGTGYSSLSYLRQFPFTTLKIDKSFIADIPKQEDDCNLTRATISLCQIMNQKVVAEGVETEEQLNFLCNNNCDIAQGYLFSKPLSEEDALKFLIEHESS